MIRTKALAGIAGLCAVALAATTAPITTATAAPAADDRTLELLSAAPSNDQAGARVRAGADRSRAVTLDAEALRTAEVGDRVTLDLFEDATVSTVIQDRSTTEGATSWTGALDGATGTFSAVEVDGVFHVSLASAEDGSFEVSSTRGGDYQVVEVAPIAEVGDDAVRPEREPARSTTQARSERGATMVQPPVAADDPSVIDVAIVYPASLPARVGEAAMQAQFALGITQTNQALAASGVGITARLVGTRQVAAPQLSTIDATYDALDAPGDGIFDEAQALREETHADLVSLWLGDPYPYGTGTSCGLGSLGGTSPTYDPERSAWTVVWADACATANLTFAHELGHNLSADHDAGASAPPSVGKPYARGYVDATGGFLTVMSYPTTCSTCTRIGHFSNPSVLYSGRPTGTPAANNSVAIAEQVGAVANYRQSQIYPGAVSIAGRARWKGTATVTSTPWAPAVTFSHQWLLDGIAVPGATGTTLNLSRRDIGKTLTVQVVGSAPYYPAVATLSVPVVVGKALFTTKRPRLRGVPRAGRLLSVSVKGWKPKPSTKSVTVRYQWLKNEKKIKGAKKSTYRVRAKDRGKKISVRVTATKKNYEKATRSSTKVKIRR